MLSRHFTEGSMQYLAELADLDQIEEVILQLINSKCLPCLLYATEACPVNKLTKNL